MEDNYIDNLNKLRKLAGSVNSLDIMDPSSHVLLTITEIIQRCKKIPEIEMVDHNPFQFIEEAEA
tara:strand:- start:253 stop:447 length:195 start_codon:yes stop_codon:yes gene_type:complete